MAMIRTGNGLNFMSGMIRLLAMSGLILAAVAFGVTAITPPNNCGPLMNCGPQQTTCRDDVLAVSNSGSEERCNPPLPQACPPIWPVPISSLNDLAKIGRDPCYSLSGDFELTNDININVDSLRAADNGQGFLPIGAYSDEELMLDVIRPPRAFTGKFDGKGYTIRGLYINRPGPGRENIGLFEIVSGCGKMRPYDEPAQCLSGVFNLNIEADTILGYNNVGVLAGLSNGYVNSCGVSGTVIAEMGAAGGLAGTNTGTVISSKANVKVISKYIPTNLAAGPSLWVRPYQAGGLVGINRGEIEISFASGDVFGFSGVGGLVGLNDNNNLISPASETDFDAGLIRFSYATGNVQASYGRAGGLVGENKGYIYNCYAVGSVSGPDAAGGLVGYNEEPLLDIVCFAPPCVATIHYSYAAGPVSSSQNAGGLVGYHNPSGPWKAAIDSYWDVTATGANTSAGVYWYSPNGGMREISDNPGSTTAQMITQANFVQWDFGNVWRIDEGKTYPYFWYQNDVKTSVSGGKITKSVKHAANAMPKVLVRGRTLNVRMPSSLQTSSKTPLQIRVLDMRGRTVLSRTLSESGTISLSKISAGRYVVDIRRAGVRLENAAIMVK